MEGWKLTGGTGFTLRIGDESGSAAGARPTIPVSDYGFPEPSLIWQLRSREVTCGICHIPGTISRHSISTPNVVGAGVAASLSVCGLTTAGTFNSDVLDFLSLALKQSAELPHPGCVNSSSFICFCRNLSMHCCTVLEIVPITQPGLSSSLILPCSVSSSSSSSPFSPLSELARSLILSAIATIISSNVFWGYVIGNPTFSAVPGSSCSCVIAAPTSSTCFLATMVSLSTYSSIHFSFSSLLQQCVSCRFPAASFFFESKLRNAPRARTVSASKPLWPSFASWHRRVDRFVDLPYLPGGSGEKVFFRALTIVVWVYFVVGRDVRCCKIWTIWRQAESFMSRLVRVLNLNQAKSAF